MKNITTYLFRFKATSLIHKQGKEAFRSMFRGFDVGLVVMLVCIVFGYLICNLIGPMVFFDNHIVLNWFVIFGYSHEAIFTFVVTVWALYYGSRLKAAIAPALAECQKGDPIANFAVKVSLLPLLPPFSVAEVVPLSTSSA